MDSGSKRKHRSRRRRINIETVSKAPEGTEAISAASENVDKEKRGSGASANIENQPSQATSASPRQSEPSSPEPNCAICLGKLENRSFTDSCFHTFCFVCLVEWSKVKAECPLCKQSFKSIYHNVRSNDDYDQYVVQRPEDQNRLLHLRHPMEGVRFRYRTTVTDHRYAHIAERIDQEIQSRLLQRPSNRLPIPNWRRIRQPASSDFRRSVYLQRLQQQSEPMNTRRRVRDTSPTFFRENPAQTHRLVPWLNRELNALLQGHGEQIAFVLDIIVGLVKRYAINSEEFYQHLLPYIGRNTRQFMREFLLFAKSPYHMSAYDRHVTYEASQAPHHDSESDSDHIAPGAADDGNDSDVVVVSPDNSPDSDSRNNPAAAPPRSDANLDPWERSIMTVGNPSYLGFPPIVRSYGQDNLSQGLDSLRNPLYRLDLPPSSSGWDSPTPGPSSIFDDMNIISTSSSQLHPGASSSIWTPSTSSYSAPITPLQTWTDSSDNLLHPLNLQHAYPVSGLVNSNTQGDPIVCKESGSEGSETDDVMIVDYEKPWEERSPIQLSSAMEDSDSDIVITGMSYASDSVKKEPKKKHKPKKREHRDKDKEKNKHHKSSRKRLAEDSSGTSKTKKRREQSRSKSRSVPRDNRECKSKSRSSSLSPKSHNILGSSSRSRSPIRMRLYKSPHYRHKKFGYSTQTGHGKEDNRQHSQRSHSSTGSRHSYRNRSSSCSLSDSDHGSESRHVTYTSHKHRDKGKHASIEILEYRKKSLKHKKSKKHKKDKKKSTTDTCQIHQESEEEILERNEEQASDSARAHKHKHSKPKKKKSNHKSHKKERTQVCHRDATSGKQKPDSTPEHSPGAESDDRRMPSDVSQHVARIFKEIAEIKQQRARKTQNFTSDTETDSKFDVESVTEKSNCSVSEKQGSEHSSECHDDKESQEAKTVLLDNITISADDNETKNKSDVEDTSTAVFHTTGLEFVELPLDQTASVDLELASITKSLDNNLDTGSGIEASSIPKQFKKHPFGHKKSGKHSSDPVITVQGTSLGQRISAVSSIQASSPCKRNNFVLEDNIQSSDISSCTDFENASHLKIDNVHNVNFLNIRHDATRIDNEGEVSSKHISDFASNFSNKPFFYESPTSSAFISPSKETRPETDFVNVETLSDGSDVDIVGENLPDTFLAVPSYRTSKDSLVLVGSHVNAALPFASSEPSGLGREIDREPQEEIDVTGISDTDSVVEFVGEEHHKITIATDSSGSDSEYYVDVLGNSDDEVMIEVEDSVENKSFNREKLIVDSDSDSTDLDYQCDTDDNKGVEDKSKSSLNNLSLLERAAGNTELDYSLKELDCSQSHEIAQIDQDDGMSSEPYETSEKSFSDKNSDSTSGITFRKASVCDRIDNDVEKHPVTACSDSSNIPASSPLAATCTDQEDPTSLQCSSFLAGRNEDMSLARNYLNISDTGLTDDKSLTLIDEAGKSNCGGNTDIQSEPQTSNQNSLTPETKIEGNRSNQIPTDSNKVYENGTTQTTSSLTSSTGSFSLTWTSSPLFEPRNSSYNSNHTTRHTENRGPDYISSVFEPRSPLFQPSPEYDQFLPVYDEFSPAASDTSEENFVAED